MPSSVSAPPKIPSRLRGDSTFSDSADRQASSIVQPQQAPAPSSETFVTVSRRVRIPDSIRVARCRRLPEYGPSVVFFSGGSAIRELSRALKNYTHNSVHLITPFDSGGSSAEIRRCYDMLSVGDLRNRLLALSDESALGNPEVIRLFSHRLDKAHSGVAQSELVDLLAGRHGLASAVNMPQRSIFLSHLRWFANRMPSDFDLRGASIGNLIITGCFLEHDRDIVTAIYLIHKLLGAKGNVRPLTGANLHIRTYYQDGTEEVGQHRMGKARAAALKSKIIKIDLVEHLDPDAFQEPQDCEIDIVSSEFIASADVIAFPMGSFFSSVLVNLLPRGVGRAITRRQCPKVYIPNTGPDPEMFGYKNVLECALVIIDMVRKDAGRVPIPDILQYVIIDTRNCFYCVDIDKAKIREMGITVIDVQLVEDKDCVVDQDPATLLANVQLDEDDTCSATFQKNHFLSPNKVLEVLLTLGT
uniref:Gluconeogenesis factor n=1 Tax=Minutocellus polymorphus TaxID=265543 RepID=A0A7S0B1H3_9STRA|mmetsp:Transcript_8595/g.14150  ORF Transcript_8595/g.14150 Transcript_8595/m.14150 type:complete len:472 (+) Transcript_8595:56-1471(+)